jgi:hypothetical protein
MLLEEDFGLEVNRVIHRQISLLVIFCLYTAKIQSSLHSPIIQTCALVSGSSA